MPPIIASGVFVLLIYGLFTLERGKKERSSAALYVPVLWFLIIGSRPVSAWLEGLGFSSSGIDFNSPQAYLDGSPIDRAVYSGLISAAVIILSRRKTATRALIQHNTILIVFLMYCLISTVWAEYTLIGLKRWIKCVGDVTMICVILTERDKDAAIRRVLVRTGFVLIPVSVLLIKFYPDLGRTYHIWTWTYMFTGVTLGKNMLGVTCLVFGLASLWYFLEALKTRRERKARQRLLAHGIVLGMTLWLFSLANSMTSVVCFVLAGTLVVLLRLTRLSSRPALMHVVVLVLIAIPFSALFVGGAEGALTSMGRDPTVTGRTAIWGMVIRMTTNPLMGAGFESFWMGERLETIWKIDDALFRGIQSAHNGFLEVFANLGWLGVFLIVAILITTYRRAARAVRTEPERQGLTFAYILIAVIYNFTEAGFRMMTPVWLALLLAVMNASIRSPRSVRRMRGVGPNDCSSMLSDSKVSQDDSGETKSFLLTNSFRLRRARV